MRRRFPGPGGVRRVSPAWPGVHQMAPGPGPGPGTAPRPRQRYRGIQQDVSRPAQQLVRLREGAGGGGGGGMPGPCERLRLPSVGSSEPSGSLQKEKHHVVVMGEARVGKSSIISQFLYDKFIEKYRETVEELHHAEYSLPDGASLTLDILDTSGAFAFPAMRQLSIKRANAFILVFAIDDARSWEEVARLRQEILQSREPRVPIVVVGNKTDLELPEGRPIKREITETTARLDWECGYVECSAKDNQSIIDVFKELLNVSKVRYNLSPAVRRRRQSLPNYVSGSGSSAAAKAKHMLKRNSCAVA